MNELYNELEGQYQEVNEELVQQQQQQQQQVQMEKPQQLNKQQIVGLVKEWMTMDERIKALQKEMRLCKQVNKDLTGQLVEVMKSHDIDCFDTTNGKILYSVQRSKQGISKKFLLEALSSYFKDNPDQVEDIGNHILDQRLDKEKEVIRRKVPKGEK
jgi:predicted RNase H-like nuclease (RuvC/YqgF family)